MTLIHKRDRYSSFNATAGGVEERRWKKSWRRRLGWNFELSFVDVSPNLDATTSKLQHFDLGLNHSIFMSNQDDRVSPHEISKNDFLAPLPRNGCLQIQPHQPRSTDRDI